MSTDYYVFPFYSKNFLGSHKVKAMSLAARGAYITLLAEQSTSENCELPNNDRILARLCICDGLDEWLSIKPEVMPCFTVSGDVIYNERLKEERQRIDQLIVKKSEAGRKSGEARREQKTNTCSTPVHSPVEQVNEHNANTPTNTIETERELTMNHKPRANNQEPRTKKEEFAANATNVSETNVSEEEKEQPQNNSKTKSRFESDTPSNNISRLLLSYCLFKDTADKRANLSTKEAQSVRNYVSELISDGYTYNEVVKFFAWHKTIWTKRGNGDFCGYSIVRDKWEAFQNALTGGFKPPVQSGNVITTVDGEEFIYLRDSKSGECFICETETETVFINKNTRKIQTRQAKIGGAK